MKTVSILRSAVWAGLITLVLGMQAALAEPLVYVPLVIGHQVSVTAPKNDQMAFQVWVDLQNKTIGWLPRGDNCCDGEICI